MNTFDADEYFRKAREKQALKRARREKRFAPLPPSTKDANGNRLCRWCKSPVPKGRLTFCGGPCVHEYKIRADANYIRTQLMKRDKGVCAVCKLDTLALGRELWAARKRGFEEFETMLSQYPGLRLPSGHVEMTGRGGYWQADHIVEVVNGGGQCGLSNLQTLCVPCHKAKTKRLAAELAARRRGPQTPELNLVTANP